MGIIQECVERAFEYLKQGEFRKFVFEIVEVADNCVHYQWHRNHLNGKVEKQLKKLEIKDEKEYCKELIKDFKKKEILNNLN
jgi:hypothetical protein